MDWISARPRFNFDIGLSPLKRLEICSRISEERMLTKKEYQGLHCLYNDYRHSTSWAFYIPFYKIRRTYIQKEWISYDLRNKLIYFCLLSDLLLRSGIASKSISYLVCFQLDRLILLKNIYLRLANWYGRLGMEVGWAGLGFA